MKNLTALGKQLSRHDMRTIKGGNKHAGNCLDLNKCQNADACNSFCNENGCGVGTCHLVGQVNRCICGAP